MKNIINKIINEEIEGMLKEQARKPKYVPGKGLKFIRYGGLSPVKQKNIKAPTRKGLWAFIWPHFDAFFIYGQMSNVHGRFKKSKTEEGERKINKNLFKEFYYDGPIFTRMDVPHSRPYGDWFLTTTKELYDYLPKQYSQDVKFLRKSEFYPKSPSDTSSIYGNQSLTGLTMVVDQFEVFIPQTHDPKILGK